MVEYAWLIPLFPLAAFALILGLGRRAPGQGAAVGVGMIGLSFLFSVGVLLQTVAASGAQRFHLVERPWLAFGNAQINIGYLVDPLTSVMLIVIALVGLMVQIYSAGYMEGDPRFPLFYAYLSLFTAAMLGLVLASNLVILYACWEVMGLTSYLLIGFWYEKPSAMRAAKKAFMVTRLGDIGFFFGILSLIRATGTASLSQLVLGTPSSQGGAPWGGVAIAAGPGLAAVGPTALAGIALLIFSGAIGKSAQFPLHVWLPDAMEGPTPVSALIHAATMVAAGVYLVARMYPIFTGAGVVTLVGVTAKPLAFVAGIGIVTALLAALIALTQPDIKRILAYSTISQLGYMIFGLGVGAFTAASFHLMTHACFKALLFLGSGSVIHGTGTQNIWEMGGLKKKMPVTFWTFFAGYLALCGIPPLAGFWSKDAILDRAFAENRLIWGLGLLGAFMTAFYMTRLMKVVFGDRQPEGRQPGRIEPALESSDPPVIRSSGQPSHPHESPPFMTVPLVVLAILAVSAGWVGTPLANWYGQFVHLGAQIEGEPSGAPLVPLMGISALVALLGIGLGVLLYPEGQFRYRSLAGSPAAMGWYNLSFNKFYFDQVYWGLLIVPLLAITQFCARFDGRLIDGIVNGVGWLTLRVSQAYRLFDVYGVDLVVNVTAWIPKQMGKVLRYSQTGRIQTYLLGLCLGAIALFWLLLRMS